MRKCAALVCWECFYLFLSHRLLLFYCHNENICPHKDINNSQSMCTAVDAASTAIHKCVKTVWR